MYLDYEVEIIELLSTQNINVSPRAESRGFKLKKPVMKFYYVYIVECSDKLLYTGITNNLSRRITEHNSGLNKTCFTYKRRPVTLIFSQEFNDVNQAIYFEKKIKKWSAVKKRALSIEDDLLLHLLAECRNASHFKNKQ